MNVYQYKCDSDYFHSVAPDPPQKVDWPNQFRGQLMGEHWVPVRLRLDIAEVLGDFMALEAHLPVISERALTCIEPLIADEVEVLEVDLVDDLDTNYYLLNVTNVIDCLDRKASTLTTFDDKILFIRRHVLDEFRLRNASLFRIEGYETGRCYVTDRFRQVVEENDLKGLLWEPLDYWTSGQSNNAK